MGGYTIARRTFEVPSELGVVLRQSHIAIKCLGQKFALSSEFVLGHVDDRRQLGLFLVEGLNGFPCFFQLTCRLPGSF